MGMRVGIIGGSIAGCATAALLHRAGHDVTVFERSESDLVSRGAGIGTPTAVWQDMMAHGLIDETLPAFRIDFLRFVTRGSGTGQQRWLGDAQHRELHAGQLGPSVPVASAGRPRRAVPQCLGRRADRSARLTARRCIFGPGGSLDFDLVVCADGYRSIGRRLIDPDATLHYRGMVLWRGLLHESDLGVDPLDGCDLLRVGYQGGHGVLYYIPGSGQRAEPGKRLLMWGYYLQVPQGALSSVLVDDQARQQSSSVPFGKVHPQVRAGLESRLADLLPPLLFELVRQSSNSAIQAIYSVGPAATPAIACAWSATPVRCSPRSRLAACSRRWPMPPHWRTPSPALRPLMMLSAGGVRPSSRSLLRSCRSLNSPSGARCSRRQTSPPCPPRRPTTGWPPPIPGGCSRSPRCDPRTADATSVSASFGRPGVGERSISPLYLGWTRAAGTPDSAFGVPFRLPAEIIQQGKRCRSRH